MKFFNTIVSALFITLGVKAQEIDTNTVDFINTLSPILEFTPDSPFNLAFAATANMNDTIKEYENKFNNSKDECLRGCYAYCIHMLEITYNLQCNSKYNSINAEYKSNKPCYKVNQDMQNILDQGNAYLDLFCSRDENNKPCSFVTDIVNMQTNTTVLKQSCIADQKNKTQCDKSLINNMSIMIDSTKKIPKDKKASYSSGGESIALTTPQYNLTAIEAEMNNSTCLVKIEPPKEVLVSADYDGKNKTKTDEKKNESSAAFISQNINTLFVILSIALTALLF